MALAADDEILGDADLRRCAEGYWGNLVAIIFATSRVRGGQAAQGTLRPAGEAERAHPRKTGPAEACPSDRRKFLQIVYNYRFSVIPLFAL